MAKINKNVPDIPEDDFTLPLFEVNTQKPQTMSFIPSFFTTASLPFKNINKNEFVRKASNGISLILNSPSNIPYGKYGRLLLSVFTTHAVLSKQKDNSVMIEFDSMSQLLKEMQLPRQRTKEIREQIECFKRATFSFEQKKEETKFGYLFKNLYEKDNYPKGDVTVTTTSTGTILFTEAVHFQEVSDNKTKETRIGSLKILLSANFVSFCQNHAVPINYTVYKDISSSVGKDLYAWLVFRNNGLDKNRPVFIPRDKLVEQFMPVGEDSDGKIANVNYSRIIDQIKDIKEKYYPELNVDVDSTSAGITLYKSPTPVIKDDVRYALLSSGSGL